MEIFPESDDASFPRDIAIDGGRGNIVHRLLLLLSGIALVGMMLVVGVEVIARHSLGIRLSGGIELTSLLMVLTIFPALVVVQGAGGHIRIEAVLNRLPVRWTRALDVVTHLLGAAVSGFVFWAAAGVALNSVAIRETGAGVRAIPVYPAKATFALAVGLLAVEFLLGAWRTLKAQQRGL